MDEVNEWYENIRPTEPQIPIRDLSQTAILPLDSIGFEMSAAFGAKYAQPEREVVSFIGDGSFQMTIQELGMCAQWNVGVKIIILDNNCAGIIAAFLLITFRLIIDLTLESIKENSSTLDFLSEKLANEKVSKEEIKKQLIIFTE